MTPEVCDASAVDESKQLKDVRDGKKYWVTKLADGNCWMTQNLDLDLDSTKTYTAADTDVSENWTPVRSTATNAADWQNNESSPYSIDLGNYYADGTYFESASCNYLTTACEHFATTPYELNGEHGHVGNHYNWSAAVASNDTSAMTVSGEDASFSICPKGWRLPYGYQSNNGDDYGKLNTAYGGTSSSDSVFLATPLFFIRGGDVYSGSLGVAAKYGSYWTSTAYDAANQIFSASIRVEFFRPAIIIVSVVSPSAV